MFDWKKRIEQHEANRELEKARKLQEQEQKDQKEREKKEKRAAAEMEANLKNLAKRFCCHVCREPAKKPSCKSHGTREKTVTASIEGYSDVTGVTVTNYIDDWSLPGDLTKCTLCKKYTCEKCLHHGICKRCAEKL